MSTRPIGKFQILGTLGTGAHSNILHVRCSSDGKQYALKVVPINSKNDNKFLEQAQHEFQVAQKLNHPNLIKVFALETPRNWLFRICRVHLLIEYVNGKTLDRLPRLSIPQLVQIFAKVAAGLVHMHQRNIFHADLKPNNIMLAKSGDVKILDYGLAWIKGEAKGRVQGTPEYMAPEQAKHGTVNEQSDIYNLGATMYRLVTFKHPPSTVPTADNVAMNAGTFKSLLKPVLELNANCPKELAELIHHCLEYSPQHRPQRMKSIEEILDKLVEELAQAPEEALENLEW